MQSYPIQSMRDLRRRHQDLAGEMFTPETTKQKRSRFTGLWFLPDGGAVTFETRTNLNPEWARKRVSIWHAFDVTGVLVVSSPAFETRQGAERDALAWAESIYGIGSVEPF